MNSKSLDIQNDLFFMKLLKKAPVHMIMSLHERIKDATMCNDKYSIICDMINNQFSTDFSPAFIQQQVEFFSSSELYNEYLMYSVNEDQLISNYQKLTNYSIVFRKIEPMSSKCIICLDVDNILHVHELSKTFLFNENVLEQCVTLYSYCKKCKWSYYPNTYCHNNSRKKYVPREKFFNVDVFYFGGESVYSHRIFLSFATALLTMRASFHGFVKYVNNMLMNKTTFPEKKMNEKCFQINWIIYSILKLLFLWTDETAIEIPYCLYDKDEVNAFFDRHKNQLYSSFVKYWCNQTMHTASNCTTKCTDIMIVDGHQKTARTTCKFNNCYDNTIEELGPVLVGCPKSVSKHSSECRYSITFQTMSISNV